MEARHSRFGVQNEQVVWLTPQRVWSLHTGTLALLIAVACYLTSKLAGTLILFPEAVSLQWPGNAVLVAVLALVPLRIWPVLIPAGLTGFVLYDVQVGDSLGTTVLFQVASTIEMLIAVAPLRYSVDGIPRLNRLKTFAKYSFFAVLLAPLVGAVLGALVTPGHYRIEWRIYFFSDALAYLTLTPALFGWLGPPSIRTIQGSRQEGVVLTVGLVLLGWGLFLLHWNVIPPALLYSLVPFLLWAALRFGSTGVGTCMIVVSFLAVWGSAHGRGPFTGPDAIQNILSLQLFLLFAAMPFMLLAILVEEREHARFGERELSGRLISAQEQERGRIARELHDDICQRLSMLSLRIEKVAKIWSHRPLSIADQLEQIWQQCSNLTGDVQALSHELHPSILDNLGLATAVKSYCREVAEQSGVVVELSGDRIPGSLPREVSLSVFRVVQEALRNAVEHSGQKHVKVCLQECSGQLELEVSDQGVGFDATKTKNGGGLGLVSMAERIYQVNGTFSIDSQPNVGTRIRARVPLAAQAKALRAAAN